MGRDLVDAFTSARDLYERADATLGRSISKLCFEGPADELNQTYNSQPAIFLTSLALLEAARNNGALPDPALVAGHSLGEYTALAAAGALTFDDGLRLVETRGRLTQQAAEATPGGMAAILGLDEETMLAVCGETGAELCNLNAPGQIVIGGPKSALTAACELALDRGAKRAIPLEVSGAFHTSLMKPAVAEFKAALDATPFARPQTPVVANNNAQPMTDPQAIRDELALQLTSPVRWVQCVEYMAAQGVTEFVEWGHGKVLTGLIKRIASGATLKNINNAGAISS